mmetsp:Transcript_44179/g.91306  ORF Transcript_44179/g.91306 Transcript_44179/m.91306 type:complete len:121 (+) Transcript_44179:134-496(+)
MLLTHRTLHRRAGEDWRAGDYVGWGYDFKPTLPIFRIHTGLVSRNELCQEWKNNVHYVANQTSQGDGIPVEELDDEEYQLFDEKAFIYDESRNRWDKGWSNNCWRFWCWPRWPAGELGEF